ncbi:MAG: sulfotransferase family protein [Bryobacteraceae bacterium]
MVPRSVELNVRDYITVVSGVPRSGTSLMMHMLEAGGIPALTDGVRRPDAHNPHGYFEYEPVKRLAADSSWMRAALGRAVKIIHRLLPHLPRGFEYRVVFMDRPLTEVFHSQREMLAAHGDQAAGQDEARIVRALAEEVRAVKEWLASRPDVSVLSVPYAGVVREPARWSGEVSRFLGGGLNEAAMAVIADPALYHQRPAQ